MKRVRPTAAELISYMQHYARKGKDYLGFMKIMSYDYDISFINGELAVKIEREYNMMASLYEEKRVR